MTESNFSPLRAELIEAGVLKVRNPEAPPVATRHQCVSDREVFRIDATGIALAARRARQPESDVEALRNSGFPGVDPRRTDSDRETKGLEL